MPDAPSVPYSPITGFQVIGEGHDSLPTLPLRFLPQLFGLLDRDGSRGSALHAWPPLLWRCQDCATRLILLPAQDERESHGEHQPSCECHAHGLLTSR